MADGALMSFHVLNTLLMVLLCGSFLYLEISFQSSDSTLTVGGAPLSFEGYVDFIL